DYFDFVQMADNRLGVAIGDVSGKGIPAALLMANLQAALQGQAIHPSTVAETVARVNDLLVRSSEVNMYATFFYGVLDGTDGSFLFCNAGHNPTLLMNSNGESDWLSEGGIVIGMMSGQPYEEGRVVIHPDDADGEGDTADAAARRIPATSRLAGHADDDDEDEEGYETEDEEEYEDEDEDDWDVAEEPNMFEEERLVKVVRQHAGGTAREIRDAVLGAVAEHTAGTPQSDDITLVVIKRTG
ncbi:PP2C family protein-serine/threonine phosphatase, partial [Gemmatimonadota bacterium]